MGVPIVHFEIGCRDNEKTQQFYRELFGWTIDQMGPAGMITTGAESGITGHITSLGHEPHHYVTVYAEVDDIGAYLERAEGLGGSVVVPENEVPGQGSFAWLKDLDGNIIGLWKPAAGESGD